MFFLYGPSGVSLYSVTRWYCYYYWQLNGVCFAGGGSLFAIHGDCEAYDTRTDRWHMVASMSTRRARVGVAAIGNRLYAVGGCVMNSAANPSRLCLVLCALDGPVSFSEPRGENCLCRSQV